jgi:ribonuclease HII
MNCFENITSAVHEHPYELVCGVDEAGRGPLAGPVVAAAVILPRDIRIEGLRDSKKLSPQKREQLFSVILNSCTAWSVGLSECFEIDEINILQATLLAMSRAVIGLSVSPDYVLVDGNQMPKLPFPGECVIKGDDLVGCISAASIIAKVTRDEIMRRYDMQYPEYGFGRHKGYPTKEHRSAIEAHGICEIHRRSFLKGKI